MSRSNQPVGPRKSTEEEERAGEQAEEKVRGVEGENKQLTGGAQEDRQGRRNRGRKRHTDKGKKRRSQTRAYKKQKKTETQTTIGRQITSTA